ncbi:carbohydrate ABC transporter substrate-binding protein (CUT1 family) [Saccharopolyspora erythraea NRRL 2338]|uniref:ABC transporter substrate-binding protein n=2 Tax=Saccharopolyspora erythraea TaxID=1836 RepID=A4FN09_SACEN|nr:extracellular solute-binding protein [Saccharopolyspora erythraea]EQD82590.1 ABC transporter substrate-binding protein [Saccharopolyspora erythraea D]PFG99077.1 carbohydrate ABC transporter substrate-binding protein (CUT1 family) [Saccharopolyspora erythraea NRRL 2338]QRK89039.1 extracellular solute-binding protein [Saccharopolyspora erythraea]CAM05434.1 putative ABC transporter substrate-binding protein [Saccharopolyspora erythraea NRRL 2338]
MQLSRRSLLAGAAGLAVAGCGRAETDPLAGKSAEPPTRPVTIEWLSQKLKSNDGSDLRQVLVDAFRAAHPNITVRIAQAPPTTDVQRATLTTQIASGAPRPDVYLGDCVWPAQFAHNSLATPLDTLVEPGFWDDFAEPVVTSLTYEDRRWAFPLYLSESFLYYRADLLAKHGIAVPRTWEELTRAARALTATGDVRYGLSWQAAPSETLTCNVAEFVADAGGELVAPDYSRATLDSAAGRRALGFVEELVGTGVSPRSVATFSEQESLTTFTGGQAAFLRNWAYAWGTAQDPSDSQVSGRIGATFRPTFDGATRSRVSTVGGWHNFVNPHTEQLGAAVAFARWMSGVDAQLILGMRSTQLPASLTAVNDPRIRQNDNPVLRMVPEVDLAPRPTRTPYYPQVSEAVYSNINPVVAGSSDPGAVLAKVSSEIDFALSGVVL